MQEHPLLYDEKRAAARLSVGRTKLFELLGTGEIKSVKIGRLRRIPESALVEYIERLSAEQDGRGSAA